MTFLKTIPFLFALALLHVPTAAFAGEALPELKGSWVAESFSGEALPPGMKMVLTFVDDETMRTEVSFQGESEKEEMKYKATKDGKITVYDNPEDNPEGETATWTIKDKKLHIKTDDGESIVLAREA